MRTIRHISTSICLFFFIVAVSVTITLACKPLYYADIKAMNLVEESGYPLDVILENYDALIKYNQDITEETLNLTLPMSENGRIHFEEVKVIFMIFQYLLLPFGLIGTVLGIWRIKKQGNADQDPHQYLKWTFALTIAVPAVLGGCIALVWDRVFVIFHELFFNNDYWIFNSKTDPIIKLLPDTFFMHCAILILALIAVGGIICLGVYTVKIKKNK